MQIEHNLQLIVAISFLRRFSPGHFLPPLFNFAATVLCVDIRLKFPTASSLTAVIKCWLSLSRKARGEAHKVATCCLCVSGGGGGLCLGYRKLGPARPIHHSYRARRTVNCVELRSPVTPWLRLTDLKILLDWTGFSIVVSRTTPSQPLSIPCVP